MKGLILNEFLDYVENKLSYDVVDKIILASELESEGAYTSIGNYDPKEFVSLVSALAKEIHKTPHQILTTYGEHLFGVFVDKYPYFFRKKESTFHFILRIETHMHVDVKKFYQEVDLPEFKSDRSSPHRLILIYKPNLFFADFAEGLIKGCIKYHGEDIAIERIDGGTKKGAKSKFILTKRG